MNRSLSRIRNVEDARKMASRALPRVLFDYMEGAADDERTKAENALAFERVTFRPRAAVAIPTPDLAKNVLGADLSLPVIIAPCGGVRLFHRDGDRVLTRVVGQFGTATITSTAIGTEVEDIAAEATGPLWFQLYFRGGRKGAEYLVDRVQRAGYQALFVTVDSASKGNHERLSRYRIPWPLEITPSTALRLAPQLLARPRWFAGYLRDGLPTSFESNLEGDGPNPRSKAAVDDVPLVASACPTWEDFAWIRELWKGPLVVKGVLTGEDAMRAVDVGADGVVVSNHGGRQLDGSPATLRVLPEVRDAVGDRTTVLIDGGIRRGTDVLKALALGANAAMIGRAYLYGLGAAGGAGVTRILELFRQDLVRSMRSLGCASVNSIDASYVDASRL
jgi:L-lactate dehydrogenase (cytochrome)